MSKKSNAEYIQNTSGKLSYVKQWDLTIYDHGTNDNNIDFTTESWEVSTSNGPDNITITNKGASNDLYVVFDALGSTITTTDRTTYNMIVEPYEQAELPGNCTSIGFRCGSGLTTTIKVRAW